MAIALYNIKAIGTILLVEIAILRLISSEINVFQKYHMLLSYNYYDATSDDVTDISEVML